MKPETLKHLTANATTISWNRPVPELTLVHKAYKLALSQELVTGMNSGWKPYQTWNGNHPIALCAQTLWANSANGSRSSQLSYWKLQKTWRNCLISWFTHSVLPSVCGWKAVEREDLMPNFSHSSCMTFEVDCGFLSEITYCGRPILHQTCSR